MNFFIYEPLYYYGYMNDFVTSEDAYVSAGRRAQRRSGEPAEARFRFSLERRGLVAGGLQRICSREGVGS